MTKKKIVAMSSIVVIFAVIIIGCAVYVNDYYRADEDAIAAFAVENDATKTVLEDNTIIYEPEEPIAGFIFYPGGKVEYTAYEPLMMAMASEGIMTVLVEMPFNLAVLDINAAEGIQEQYPEIEEWYIGGHSLGGSMAASYLGDHAEEFEGLILLGSYSTENLSETDLNVISIYGSEDMVLNKEKYEENIINLPENFEEIVIEGGCHAYFGMYGEQEGDGTPTITKEEQIKMTVNLIEEFVNK